MKKRLIAIAGASLLVVQMLGIGTAFATSQQDSECDFGSDDLEITLGKHDGSRDDVELYLDDEGTLYCDAGAGDEEQAASTIDSITVEMDDDDSTGVLTVYLDDTQGDAAEWPEFDTFDIDVTTKLYLDGGSVSSAAANDLRVIVGSKTLEFAGTEASYVAPVIEVTGGDRNDVLDASKASVKVTVDGGLGKDTIKGGSKNDALDGGAGVDLVWGGIGNDTIDCGGDRLDQGWGQSGYDTLTDCYLAGPGSEDDEVSGETIVSYTDLTSPIKWTNLGEGITTGGAAGDDLFSGGDPDQVYGSQGDDLIVDAVASSVNGAQGDDVVKVDADAVGGDGDDLVVALDGRSDGPNRLDGNGGDDILRGKKGADFLVGGPGYDQAWGGTGTDTCGAEVTNRCEYLKK